MVGRFKKKSDTGTVPKVTETSVPGAEIQTEASVDIVEDANHSSSTGAQTLSVDLGAAASSRSQNRTSESPKKPQRRASEDSLIAYVHKLSPKKKTRRQTMEYSTLVLQTNDTNVEALLYAVKKRPLLEDSYRSRMPIKVQRFTKTPDGRKLITNEMTKLSAAKQGEYSFQFQAPEITYLTSREILECQEWDTASLVAKAVHVGTMAMVGAKSSSWSNAPVPVRSLLS